MVVDTAGGPLLQVESVGLSFGTLRVLDRASFALEQGTILGLIGPNGAGKTSLFNCISGLYRYDSGDIFLAGRSLRGAPPDDLVRLGVARTFQQPALFGGLSVIDQIQLALDGRAGSPGWLAQLIGWPGAGRSAAQRLSRAQATLERFGLSGLADRPVAMLSLAERRRLEIARAIALEPRLLLLDEPAAGLDEREQAALACLLKDLRDGSGLTVVLIDHRMHWVQSLCDRLVALQLGRVIASGPTAQVCADPVVIDTYLGVRSDRHPGASCPQAPVH
jgi:branched-chain amino acid transport system ATP-binding protein